MFKDAVALAMNFTLPVVMSYPTVSGDCGTGNGTCVLINAEGWIVTAAHILKQLNDLHCAS
jgi:hypothetical protein